MRRWNSQLNSPERLLYLSIFIFYTKHHAATEDTCLCQVHSQFVQDDNKTSDLGISQPEFTALPKYGLDSYHM